MVRSVFKTMLYAGASEIIADAGNYAMGAGLAGKLSTRLAQGMECRCFDGKNWRENDAGLPANSMARIAKARNFRDIITTANRSSKS